MTSSKRRVALFTPRIETNYMLYGKHFSIVTN